MLVWHWGRKGGGPRYTFNVARVLARDPGLEIHISASRQAEIFAALVSIGLPRLDVDTYRGAVSGTLAMARLPAVRARFGRYLRDHRIDVVVCTMPHLWNVAMLRQIRRAGARYLMTIHDATLHPGEDLRVRRWLLDRETRAADAVVALSEHVRRQLVAIYGIRPERSAVIPHGVSERNGPDSRPRKFPTGRAVRLLFFGRLLPYKGLDLLLHAFTSLRKQFPNVELVVAGAGTLPGHSAMLRATPGVRVENKWICETKVDDLFREADLVLLPYREASQSGVIAHAFEHRLPVVATPVGGLAEQVTHMRTGVIACSVSAEGITEAASTLLSAPALYEECSAEIGRVVESSLAWPRIGTAMSRMIKETAGRASDVPAGRRVLSPARSLGWGRWP